jgi:hypothetical protein
MATANTQQVRDVKLSARRSAHAAARMAHRLARVAELRPPLRVAAWERDCCMPGVSTQQAVHATTCMVHGVARVEDLR